jgi:glutamate 5-kinase
MEGLISGAMNVVFRIEITTLIGTDGKLELKKMERLAMLCTNLMNSGIHVIIVSSGAIVLGSARLHLAHPPVSMIEKQAAAAIGQADLISFYQQFFDGFKQLVAQVLLTNDDFADSIRNLNARNTLLNLMGKRIIPIINENDSVSVDDIVLGDNYPLAYEVAKLANSRAIIIKREKSDEYTLIDGLRGSVVFLGEEHLTEKLHRMNQQVLPEAIDFSAFPASIKEMDIA